MQSSISESDNRILTDESLRGASVPSGTGQLNLAVLPSKMISIESPVWVHKHLLEEVILVGAKLLTGKAIGVSVLFF